MKKIAILCSVLIFSISWLTAVQFGSSNPNTPITDGGYVSNSIYPNTPGIVSDINIGFTLYHTWDSDLMISVEHDGVNVNLVIYRGANGQNMLNTVLDDQATIPIASGYAPFTGRFTPESPLSAFNGHTLDGPWTIGVLDAVEGHTGTFISWYIDATYAVPPNEPFSPTPTSGSLSSSSSLNLSWRYGNCAQSFDLLLGTTNPPTQQLVTEGTATNNGYGNYSVNGLAPFSTYYWQVVVHANGLTVNGPVWSFTTPWALGDGTQANPYQIANMTDLRWLSGHSGYWGSWFSQTADIDAISTHSYYDGWSSVGNETVHFTGHYDGQNHTISNLYFVNANTNYKGFFGYVEGGSLQNINMNQPYFLVLSYVGGVAGYCTGTSITNCHTTGGTIESFYYTGGLVGRLNGGSMSDCSNSSRVEDSFYASGVVGMLEGGGTITDCYNTGEVDGYERVGGLVGYATGANTISGCYSYGSVIGNAVVGGLIGKSEGSTAIRNCYFLGSVDTGNGAGGLVGQLQGTCSVTNCYSSATVTGTGTMGGLIGSKDATATVTTSFWNSEISGLSSSAGGVGITSSMLRSRNFPSGSGWNFSSIWAANGITNTGFPYLQWQQLGALATISASQLDFGVQICGATAVTRTVTVKNVGTDNLIINQTALQNGTLGYNLPSLVLPATIAPNDSLVISIAFSPTLAGNCTEVLTISVNSSNTSTLVVTLYGAGEAATIPSVPQNVTIAVQNDDVVINWSPVTTTVYNTPLSPSGYAVLSSTSPTAADESWSVVGYSIHNSYTHAGAAALHNNLFYRVKAITGAIPE